LGAGLGVVLLGGAAMPASAQEPVTLLDQPEWPAMGVCVGIDQCGACVASDVHDGVSLRVSPPNGVEVQVEGGSSATAVTLEIGPLTFTLPKDANGDFTAADKDGNKIIQVMREETSLTLRLAGEPSAAPYRYRLEEFPTAYAAIVRSCPGAEGP